MMRLFGILLLMLVIGCGAESGTSDDSLSGKVYSYTGTDDGVDFTWTMSFGAEEVEDKKVPGATNTYPYTLVDNTVRVVIGAGNVVEYLLSSNKQTLTVKNDPSLVLNLQNFGIFNLFAQQE